VLCHHTASSSNGQAAIPLLVNGRSDLPGPLCQLSLDRQGVVYVVAAGRANHAGVAKPSGTVAGGDGNVLYIGIEAQNEGTGEPWPKAQYDAYVTLCAALCVEITGNSANTVRAHKETSVTGKIDPAGPTPYESTFDMDKFRARVGARSPS
jgi:N-acetyl-anhydromuramyl-L-alanine amidase AmpD